MRKLNLTALFITLMSALVFGQNNIFEGKVYNGVVSQSCKLLSNGGCLITTYNTFTFGRDSVQVDSFVKEDCDVTRRNSRDERPGNLGVYSYQVQKKLNSPNYLIRVDGYEIGSFEAFPDRLVEFINDPNYPASQKKIFKLEK